MVPKPSPTKRPTSGRLVCVTSPGLSYGMSHHPCLKICTQYNITSSAVCLQLRHWSPRVIWSNRSLVCRIPASEGQANEVKPQLALLILSRNTRSAWQVHCYMHHSKNYLERARTFGENTHSF